MTPKKIDLPIHKHILNRLKEPIAFVNADGLIIGGNCAALALLDLKEWDNQSITSFINFDMIKQHLDTHTLLNLYTQPDKILDVKSVQIDAHTYCIIINELSLQERKAEVKAYISELDRTHIEGMVVLNNTQIIDADETFVHMFGYSLKELKMMDLSELVQNRCAPVQSNPLSNAHKIGTCDLIGVKKDGTTFYAKLNEKTYINGQNGQSTRIALIKDISEQVANEKQIEYMAYYDELTDMPNRNFFIEVLKQTIEEAEKTGEIIAIYFIDLDYFKEINDTHGYAFGDELLRACGNRLKTLLQEGRFIARMGGDEFLLMQRQVDNVKGVSDFAEAIIKEFEKPINIRGYDIYITLSIGISLYPQNGQTATDLIKHADSAMYVIKEKHRNHYNLFDSSISENFKTMLTMENEMRKALREHQFRLHYQPQKSLRSGHIIGMEALLRWEHPVRGMVSPGEFIPLAEKTGLIIQIGDWVIAEACRQNKQWQDEGYKPVIVSVNLSARQFHQKDLVEKIERVLTTTGLEAQYLELEITESMAMSHESYILDTMKRLRELGVHVSIDDFGTGYSSLKYLSLFPITKLKIDKMFINGKQEQNKAIVKSIIHMSHSLNMKVIAEGVETSEQLSFLEKEKCDEMQGFYFSKPLPPKDISNLFDTATLSQSH
ncbi:sensor domain-containing protein [Lentibacillus saliphilus]|uniref:sensor domain-containing protein n=1 Tax=Lentibacillus saliphilus TaxID=2737028 RepID=UPI001C2FBCCC|nr:EAL domain-containing protein [Lentibacillus saliphilus]